LFEETYSRVTEAQIAAGIARFSIELTKLTGFREGLRGRYSERGIYAIRRNLIETDEDLRAFVGVAMKRTKVRALCADVFRTQSVESSLREFR
jgi:hypothetical protein